MHRGIYRRSDSTASFGVQIGRSNCCTAESYPFWGCESIFMPLCFYYFHWRCMFPVKIETLGIKGKTLLGFVSKLLKTKSFLTAPSHVLPFQLKQTFTPKIWIFTEGEGYGIGSSLPFKIFSTSPTYIINEIATLVSISFSCVFTKYYHKHSVPPRHEWMSYS